MWLDFIQKLLGIKNVSSAFCDTFVRNTPKIPVKNVNFATPAFELSNVNVVHSELKAEKEIEDLYAEIRVLQENNRQKLIKNKFSYNIR